MVTTDPAAPTPRLTDLLLDFLAYLELERGLSRNTLEAYRSDLQQYGEFLARRGTDPLDVMPADLAAFISELADGREGRPAVAPATAWLIRLSSCTIPPEWVSGASTQNSSPPIRAAVSWARTCHLPANGVRTVAGAITGAYQGPFA